MALGADYVQAAELLHALAEQDVDTTSGHVGRHGDRALLARARDDERLALVVLRVEDLMLQAVAPQLVGEALALVDRRRADEHRLPSRVALLHVAHESVPLALLGLVHEIGIVLADHRLVRRDDRDLELVDLVDLLGLGRGRAGHARELVVHAEVVLDRDRGVGACLALDLHALLRLDRLMQPIAPAPSRHEAARELVDDDDLAVLDDVLAILQIQGLRLHRVVEVMHGGDIALIHVLDAQEVLGPRDAVVGERRRAVFLVDDVIAFLVELRRHRGVAVVRLGRVLSG